MFTLKVSITEYPTSFRAKWLQKLCIVNRRQHYHKSSYVTYRASFYVTISMLMLRKYNTLYLIVFAYVFA